MGQRVALDHLSGQVPWLYFFKVNGLMLILPVEWLDNVAEGIYASLL